MQQQHMHSAVLVSLPSELERMIFELAVRDQNAMVGGVMHILLVCNRVKEWIEGIIYESLILDAPLLTTRLLLRTLASKTGRHEFFARTVKRVYLSPIVSAEEAAFVLSMCTGAKEIVSWAPEIGPGSARHSQTLLLDYLQHNSALKHLAVRSNDIFGHRNMANNCASYSSSPPHSTWSLLLSQMLSNITHLCIINPPEPTHFMTVGPGSKDVYATDYDALLYMPSLTHSVFGKLWIRPHKALFPFFTRILLSYFERVPGSGSSDSIQSLLLISSETAFINHAKKWHECDVGSDCRVTFGKEYDYRSMGSLGWVRNL